MPIQSVVLAEPRGFCAGVEMAIKALTWMVRVFEPPVYCYHEIVHNQWVVRMFEDAGVVFVDDVEGIPAGAPVMLSAHGSAPGVVESATARAGVIVDAVCPLVTKVHHEVKRAAQAGLDIIYVGHEGHDEAIGTMAVAPASITLVEPGWDLDRFQPVDPGKVALLAQTTLGRHEWESVLVNAQTRYPSLVTARRSDLCYATTNRQDATTALAVHSDLVLVVGSLASSNTGALVRVAEEHGSVAYRIDDATDIKDEWLVGVSTVGVTAGASAPDHLVQEVIDRLAPVDGVELLQVVDEDEYFPLPPQLRNLLRLLESLVEAGVARGVSTQAGLLEHDAEWTASEALSALTGTNALGAI
jgi:4-hydroxy-3-methylbut-2-enyl diphosphate reductase